MMHIILTDSSLVEFAVKNRIAYLVNKSIRVHRPAKAGDVRYLLVYFYALEQARMGGEHNETTNHFYFKKGE